MITFFHTADIHFGMENYGKIDPHTGIHTRLLDFEKTLDSCISAAIKQKPDFFLFAGDAYKTATPSPTQQKLFLKQFLRLQEHGIPVVMVVGNHDLPISFGKAHALDIFTALPVDGFHLFAKPGVLKLETKNGPVQIVALPWPTRNNIVINKNHRFKDSEELAQYIAQKMSDIVAHLAATLDPTIPAILAGHMSVAEGVFSGSERKAVFGTDPTLLVSQLAIEPFNYVALGHLHRHQNLNPKGTIPVVYSGSLEAIDFGELRDKKGYCVISISRTKDEPVCNYDFVPVKTRPMVQIDCILDETTSQTDQLLTAIAKKTIDGAIVKISYHIPTGQADTININKVHQALSKAAHIASITPIHAQIQRTTRIGSAHASSDTTSLLTSYFSSLEIEKKTTERLMTKAKQLEQDIINKLELDENEKATKKTATLKNTVKNMAIESAL